MKVEQGELIAGDLNRTIANAVNARVEAEMVKALSGVEVIGRYVTAALQQQVEVKVGYDTKRVSFLDHTLAQTIQAVTKEVARRVVAEELPAIEAGVRKALKAKVGQLAETFVGKITNEIQSDYRMTVEVNFQR